MAAAVAPLACPRCHAALLEGDPLRCSRCQNAYPAGAAWLDFLGSDPGFRTPAQASNILPPTAHGYELWRRRSLTILSGQHFPLPSELELMTLLAPAHGWVLDLGCSTAIYARHLAQQPGVAGVLAVDIAPAMLGVAAQRLADEAIATPLLLLRARAQALPILDASLGGVYIGGSLNEMGDTPAVLEECARVLRPGGVLFIMYIRPATATAGRLAQLGAGGGGIAFFAEADLHAGLRAAGLAPTTSEAYGAVGFQVAVRP